ncbi:MAG: hypothetical protein RR275_08050 [Lachnospiraceae bacterium]
MKRKYSIGFFCGMISIILLLTGAYYLSYQKAVKKYEIQLEQAVKQEATVTTDGLARKETGYYLKERNGFILVYLSDGVTIYEDTNIKVDILPKELQDEIKKGKYLETTEILYGFLENYSS